MTIYVEEVEIWTVNGIPFLPTVGIYTNDRSQAWSKTRAYQQVNGWVRDVRDGVVRFSGNFDGSCRIVREEGSIAVVEYLPRT